MYRAPELEAYLRNQRRAMVDLLRRLALAESPSSDAGGQEAVLAILSGALSDSGFLSRRVPGRRHGDDLYARPRKRGGRVPVQLLLGHCDTVWPLGTVEEMPVEADGGVVRGPGVYDMKGGLVQMVFALRALRELGLEPTVMPVVFVNSDEEVGSPESGRHIRRMARVAERAFVLEPSLGLSGSSKAPVRAWGGSPSWSADRRRTRASIPGRGRARSWSSRTRSKHSSPSTTPPGASP